MNKDIGLHKTEQSGVQIQPHKVKEKSFHCKQNASNYRRLASKLNNICFANIWKREKEKTNDLNEKWMLLCGALKVTGG